MNCVLAALRRDKARVACAETNRELAFRLLCPAIITKVMKKIKLYNHMNEVIYSVQQRRPGSVSPFNQVNECFSCM